MASCHTHAAIIHIHRRVWYPAIPTLPSSHIHAPIISTYSVSGVRGYGKMSYPPKNAIAIISRVRGYGRMPYPPKNATAIISGVRGYGRMPYPPMSYPFASG